MCQIHLARDWISAWSTEFTLEFRAVYVREDVLDLEPVIGIRQIYSLYI